MNIRKIVQRRIRHEREGIDLAADVNAVIAANVGESGTVNRVSSRQRSTAQSPRDESTRDGGGDGSPQAEGTDRAD